MPQHPIRNFILLGKKDETFTQQLLQSAVAIAALHLILELLTKVLSLSLSFFSVAAGRRAFSALFCSDLRLLSCCFILFKKSLCPLTMAVRRGMTVFKVSVLDMSILAMASSRRPLDVVSSIAERCTNRWGCVSRSLRLPLRRLGALNFAFGSAALLHSLALKLRLEMSGAKSKM